LFFRSSTMVSAMRRVLQRAEQEEEVAQWEDLASQYR
jgi:hypothetical protein